MAAWSLAGFTVLVLVAAPVLGFDASRMVLARIVFCGLAGLAVVLSAGAGGMIVSRVPRNAIAGYWA